MEIVGRLCQTPMQKQRFVTAFHRNALRNRTIVFLISLLQTGPMRAAEAKIWEEFSGDKAFALVQRLVDFGPRPAGSDALEKSRTYIEEQLRLYGWNTRRQAYTEDTPRGKTHFVNLIAQFGTQKKAASPVFLLCTHYDTKVFDTISFVGANDGGSSTGLVLELARVIGQHPTLASKVELVFFDGEEACEQFSYTDGLYGSRYFARQLQRGETISWRAVVRHDWRSVPRHHTSKRFPCRYGAGYFCRCGSAEVAKLFHLSRPGSYRRSRTAERHRDSDTRRH